MPKITFGEIRQFFSRIDRISVCMEETGKYCNYRNIKQVPHDFDGLYLYGVGIIDTEFEENDGELERRLFEKCLEIMLSEKPRTDIQA